MSGNITYQNYTEGRPHPTIQELSKFKVEDKPVSTYLLRAHPHGHALPP